MSKLVLGLVIGGLLGYHYGYNKAMNPNYSIMDRLDEYRIKSNNFRPKIRSIDDFIEYRNNDRVISIDYVVDN